MTTFPQDQANGRRRQILVSPPRAVASSVLTPEAQRELHERRQNFLGAALPPQPPRRLIPQPEFHRMVATLVQAALQQPGGKLDILSDTGAIIATVQAHRLPVRPKDMPRALRPKRKLSKRQRAAAKRDKQVESLLVAV